MSKSSRNRGCFFYSASRMVWILLFDVSEGMMSHESAAEVTVGSIAHLGVTSVGSRTTVAEAIRVMEHNDLRDVIFRVGEAYRIFTVRDLLSHVELMDDVSIPLEDLPFHPLVCIAEETPVRLAIAHFDDDQNRYLGVVNTQGSLIGVVSHSDIIAALDPAYFIRTCPVGEVFHQDHHVAVVGDTPVREVVETLKNVEKAVLVVNQGQPVGILTSKDAIRMLASGATLDVPVRDFMRSPVDTINQSASLHEVLQYLQHTGYKRAVVVDGDGQLVGTVNQSDLASRGFYRWSQMMASRIEGLSSLTRKFEERAFEFEREALTDSLTGLGNRRHFNQILDRERARYHRYGGPAFCIGLIDIDRFKAINDRHGHLKGDEVLRALARTAKASLRQSDLICRWGGEEFAIFLPETTIEGAWLYADRLRCMVAEEKLAGLSVTISIGVTEYLPGESINEVLSRVDGALYQAKRSGRNRCIAATAEMAA